MNVDNNLLYYNFNNFSKLSFLSYLELRSYIISE